jgi:hypothetical protein
MVVELLNEVQKLSSEVSSLRSENQLLRDEVNRLKGEQGRPYFNKKRKPIQPTPNSGDPCPTPKGDILKAKPKKDRVKIDRVEYVRLDRSTLPSDAVFKGYKNLVEQNLRLVRDNVAYKVEVYHSKSTGKSYRARLPKGYRGAFGYDLLSLTQIFHHCCDVTHSRLSALYKTLGLSISKGTICNMLLQEGQWAIAERDNILKAGLQHSSFIQMDGTQTIQSGQPKSTQILCAKHFKVFYTRQRHKRLDVISALQGLSTEPSKLCFNRIARHFMNQFKVTHYDRKAVAKYLPDGEPLSFLQAWEYLDRDEKLCGAKPARRTKLNDALSLGHYFTQQEYPIADFILSDDAHEYKAVGRYGHALCWVHDARPYRKLSPRSPYHRRLLAEFMDRYWSFYQQLKEYRAADLLKQKASENRLVEQFGKLFNSTSDYGELQIRMNRTYANRKQLLTFLDQPAIPLHNNSAERGARRVVRKRDISLHTSSDQGTIVRDSFLSVIETARKLGVNVFDYINRRVRQQHIEEPLDALVTKMYLA